MSLIYHPDSKNVLVLEPDILNVAYRLEELLNRFGYNMEHYDNLSTLLEDFKNVNSDFSKIILAYTVLQSEDLPKFVHEGGLTVACELFRNFQLSPKIISIYSRATGKEYEKLIQCCKILGIKYIQKFAEEEIKEFLRA